jgi:protein-S-isoprenylcysteine O-methyltransferase Ste14
MRVQARPARPASVPVNLLKSVGYTVVLWTVFFAAIPCGIRWVEETLGLNWARLPVSGVRTAAVLVFGLGGAVAVWSAVTLVTRGDGTPMPLECTRRLVIAGPYRYLRNPMASVGILQGIAVALFLGSSLTVVYALLGALLWHCVLRPWEERDLALRFGTEYEEYRRSVPLWLPRLTPFDPVDIAVRLPGNHPGRTPG